MIPYFVLTSDGHDWLIPGFMHQWKKYLPEIPVTVVGFTPPKFKLLEGFNFVSIGKFEDYPIKRWSDALINLVTSVVPCAYAGILFEDYWLTRRADYQAIQIAEKFIQETPNTLRFDLCTDRLYCGNFRAFTSIDRIDIIEGLDSPYQISFQASIWNTDGLLKVVPYGWDPWRCETEGNNVWREKYQNLRVFGTRQWPLSYQIMVANGKFSRDGNWMYPKRQVSDQDFFELQSLGYTVKHE